EDCVDLAVSSDIEDLGAQPHRAPRRFCLPSLKFRNRTSRIDEDGDTGHYGHHLAHEFQPLRNQFAGEDIDTRDVGIWARKAGDKPQWDWSLVDSKPDRDGWGARLTRDCRSGAASCNDARPPPTDQIGCQPRQPIEPVLSPAVFDGNVLPLGIANFLQSLAE